jgi:hypothetical protein
MWLLVHERGVASVVGSGDFHPAHPGSNPSGDGLWCPTKKILIYPIPNHMSKAGQCRSLTGYGAVV